MSAPFVPLFPQNASRDHTHSGAGGRVFKQTDSTQGFVPIVLEPGGAVPVSISAHDCRASAGDKASAPSVTLEREGDRVKHIRIQCACGGIIELECAY